MRLFSKEQLKILRRELLTKKGLLHKSRMYDDIAELRGLMLGHKIRPIKASNMSYNEDGSVLRALQMFKEMYPQCTILEGNDAPRGGRTGDYYQFEGEPLLSADITAWDIRRAISLAYDKLAAIDPEDYPRLLAQPLEKTLPGITQLRGGWWDEVEHIVQAIKSYLAGEKDYLEITQDQLNPHESGLTILVVPGKDWEMWTIPACTDEQ
jgi:hypothetical protein